MCTMCTCTTQPEFTVYKKIFDITKLENNFGFVVFAGVSTIINGPQTLPHMPKGGGGKYSPVIPEHFLTSPHHSMGSPSRAHPNFYPLNSIPHSGSSSSPNYLQGNPPNPSSHIPLHEMDSNPGTRWNIL